LLASCYARRLPVNSGSHTVTPYIGVTSNLYVRVLQHKEGTLEGFTATYGCERLLYFEGYEDIRTAIAGKRLKGWRREKLNLIRTLNPEFKDLAQTWGWEMITVRERCTRNQQVRLQRILFSCFGGRKAPSRMGNISTAGVLRLRAAKRCVTR
jgi:putative endonuclease